MISMETLPEFEKRIKKDKITSCLIYQGNSLIFQYYKNNKMKEKLHKVELYTDTFKPLQYFKE